MFGFFHGKFQKFLKTHLGVQVSKTIGRFIVQTLLHMSQITYLTFQCALSAKKKDRSL